MIIERLLIFTLLLTACSAENQTNLEPTEPSERIIQFSGYDWYVRSSGTTQVGPGPNYFSDSKENVWVDEAGRLHLKIIQAGGEWYCAGVSLRRSLGYGQYVFYLNNDVSLLDRNVVGGLFAYKNDEEEIDIEFSKWSDEENQNAQFVVQPGYKPDNKKRYNLNLEGENSTHFFKWLPDYIEFSSFRGLRWKNNEEGLIQQWRYEGDDIPPHSEERLKMNLWLFRGQLPSDHKEHEMIIDRFEFIKSE